MLYRKIFFLFLILFSLNSFTAPLIIGEGRFETKEEDSLPFIKEQLLLDAFHQIITKELTTLGLNEKIFWEKIGQNLDVELIPIQKKLKRKYRIGVGPKNSSRTAKYLLELRMKSLLLKKNHEQLEKFIGKYSVLEMTRAVDSPLSRFVKVSAVVNRSELISAYKGYTNGDQTRKFKYLFISFDLNTGDMSLEDIGIDFKSELTDALKKSWKEWSLKNFNTYIDEVVIVNEQTARELDFYLHQKNGNKDLSIEEIKNKMDWKNSLWLKITTRLTKKTENKVLRVRGIESDGGLLIMDIENKSLITHYDFKKEIKNYSYQNKKRLSSRIASRLYRLITVGLDRNRKQLEQVHEVIQTKIIVVENLASIAELFQLKNIMKADGVTIELDPKIKSFGKNKGLLSLRYKGNESSLQKVLQKLDQYKLSGGKVVTFPKKESFFVISLLKQ